MRLEDLPDFAKPYKKTGYDVRLCGKAYRLLRISSKRVKGKKYPVISQEYIGTILEDGTLKKSKAEVRGPGFVQEFGLSDFLMKRFRRTLQRSIYGYDAEKGFHILLLGILFYVFGTVSEEAIKRCRLTCKYAKDLSGVASEQRRRIERLSQKVAGEQEKLFGADRADFEMFMRLCVVDSVSEKTPEYPEEALEILHRHEEASS